MSELAYTVDTYLTAISISTKKRVLVEGRYDRQHLNNLLSVVAPHNKIHIDAAQYIKSSDKGINKNNRKKVEAIHQGSVELGIDNVYFLCDREFRSFSVADVIKDDLEGHYSSNKLHWTYGHSMENYFFHKNILIDAYRYLFSGENKNLSFNLFERIIDSSFQLIAALTLASREMQRLTFPLSLVTWRDFIIQDDKIFLKKRTDLTWQDCEDNNSFYDFYHEYFSITSTSPPIVCSRISRGHTAMIILQRVFSACVFNINNNENKSLAEEGANKFSNISEEIIANALSESWVRKIDRSQHNYPVSLFDVIVG
ncbi:DUF4435 domain-containing protein [Erwinia aphidicola]|uniref:DUF4435 domain-containing protein n=1 Tax=Erwinia aphidicola TaxID=68334 RepID=UPI0020A113EA|nr:DUF4435 domain-containing protein [Erwinia aphidicola]MCP2230175.1 hypothetical protein [Erwinia aphidicola]